MRTLSLKITMIFLFSICLSCAQANFDKTIRILSYGEEVPDYPLVNMVNYPKESAKISDFKGKAMILDYWFTGCKPCIASWPKLEKLQQKYGDKIQIVLVNHMQDKTTVQQFMDNWEKHSGTTFTIPSVTGDTTLFKAFPPSGYPSIAWIDPNGRFQAFTDGSGLNEENIRFFLNGNTKAMTEKKLISELQEVDVFKPLPDLLGVDWGDTSQLQYYSTISSYSPKSTGMRIVENGTILPNMSILNLIRDAYAIHEPQPKAGVANYPTLPSTRYILGAKDAMRFQGRINGKMYLPNLYTYRLIFKEPRTFKQIKKKMQEDIQNYFNLDIRWEKQKRKCLVLKAEDTTLINDFKGGREKVFIYNKGTFKETYKIENFTPMRFLAYLESRPPYSNSPYPILDETGFQGLLDLEYPSFFLDSCYKHGEFDAYLHQRYKMRFVLEEREIDILVIRDSEDGEIGKVNISL
ncbi:TlpA family protein disulfide reductase [Sinomicrobium oceani]|uniref:TlpA family protein disulfide reductase n=1 Tax=Sinomicrobium oceani TaxID=1150368 RepID=UPI00227C7B7F|nr:redoxin family protein [Sinomicrobium oceani]